MSSDDILADWKKERFIVAERVLTADLTDNIVVIMTDYKFWAKYADECIKWCQQYNCEVKGMTIEIPDADTLLLFRLRWA